jgi:hypothetical protein
MLQSNVEPMAKVVTENVSAFEADLLVVLPRPDREIAKHRASPGSQKA